MKVRKIEPVAVSLPMARPMKMGGVKFDRADNVLVRIETDSGLVGWGEASSAPSMTGETVQSMVAAIRYLAPWLDGCDPRDFAGNLAVMERRMYGNTSARTVLEMALYDIAGKAAGQTVAELLGGVRRQRMPVLWMLATGTREADVPEAQVRFQQGFQAFKIKVGGNPAAVDVERTIEIRQHVDGAQVSADANQGWDVDTALAYVAGASAALDFFEQPVVGADVEGMARIAAVSHCPIGADEGLHSLQDIRRHKEMGAAQGGSLKMIKLGGVTRAYEAAVLCAELGMNVNLAGKVCESSISSAAVLNLAAAVPQNNWGLSITTQYLADDVVRNPVVIRDGMGELPAGPGLGVEVDEDKVHKYAVAV
jgi:muconate cycloisomerase